MASVRSDSPKSSTAAASAGRGLEVFVPGRICIMGEHSDWAGGYRRFNSHIKPGMCLVSGTTHGLYAKVTKSSKLRFSSVTHTGERHGPFEVDMDPQKLLQVAELGEFFSYVCGVAYQILIRYRVEGLEIVNYKTTLPVQKGLSSSAAVTVLTARAFNRFYDLKLTVRGEMDLAYQGEITTPSRCGRMDQCCAFGVRPVLMKFDGDRLDCEEFKRGAPLHLVIVELGAFKDTQEILAKLNKAFPSADTDVERGVQMMLGEINERIVKECQAALAAGDMPKVGQLMNEFQENFDKYLQPQCPSQLTAPVLHKVLQHPPLQGHIHGCKGVGSQGDGCAQFLCKSEEDMDALIKIVESDFKMSCLPLTIGTARPLTRALIPAANFGPGLFPATKGPPCALFPIVDKDGIAKPAILMLVEEAIEAGIQEVVIVVSKHDYQEFNRLFHEQLPFEHFSRLNPQLQKYAEKIEEMGRCVELVIQEQQLGLGNAVLTAKQQLGNEPFMLMLGDHLYSTANQESSCVQQLLKAYKGTSMLGLRYTDEADVSKYGAVTGDWVGAGSQSASGPVDLKDVHLQEGAIPKGSFPHHLRTLSISEIVEKPSADYARSKLRVPSLPSKTYLAAFGLYIITEGLMDYLEEEFKAKKTVRDLYELTPSLDRMRKEKGFLGYVIDGQRHDIGSPSCYAETVNFFSSSGRSGA